MTLKLPRPCVICGNPATSPTAQTCGPECRRQYQKDISAARMRGEAWKPVETVPPPALESEERPLLESEERPRHEYRPVRPAILPDIDPALLAVMGAARREISVRRAGQFAVIDTPDGPAWRLAEDVELSDTVLCRQQNVETLSSPCWKTTRLPLVGEKRPLPDGTVLAPKPARARRGFVPQNRNEFA